MGGVNVTGLLVTEEAGGPGTAIRYPHGLMYPSQASGYGFLVGSGIIATPRPRIFFSQVLCASSLVCTVNCA